MVRVLVLLSVVGLLSGCEFGLGIGRYQFHKVGSGDSVAGTGLLLDTATGAIWTVYAGPGLVRLHGPVMVGKASPATVNP